MTTPKHESGGAHSAAEKKPDIEEIQASIEQTRGDLGETVDELAAKLDVKSRTKVRMTEIKAQGDQKVKDVQRKASELSRSARASATDDRDNPRPELLAGAAGFAALVLTTILLTAVRRKRRRTRVTVWRADE